MKLSQLLHDFLTIPAADDIEITGLALNSKAVKPGDLFLAFPGVTTDGRKFIDDAITCGAVAILVEEDPHPNPALHMGQAGEGNGSVLEDPIPSLVYSRGRARVGEVPIFYLKNLGTLCGQIAAQFYDHPSKKLQVIGVTGTNGKTSCTHFLAAAFTQLGIKSAVMGTVGNGIYGEMLNTQAQTTLDPISIQRFLADMVQQDVKIVAMEVSSHALIQGRVRGVQFAAAVFTNLTQDHLDYHSDMESYWQAKRKLFEDYDVPRMIINADDKYGQELLKNLASISTVGYTLNYIHGSTNNMVIAAQIKLSCAGIHAQLNSPWGEGELVARQMGRYNLSNLLAVIATMGSLGVSLDDILTTMKNLPLVPGRLQTFNVAGKPLVVVDYAHTPDALQNVLSTLRENCEGKLWCIFGCGGDRDATKRPMMGKIVEQLADKMIITDDNPRTEDPTTIVAQIVQGLSEPKVAMIKHDRTAAIQYAIEHAAKDDIIVVAGKGHEDYQEIGKEKRHYSDIETVQKLLD